MERTRLETDGKSSFCYPTRQIITKDTVPTPRPEGGATDLLNGVVSAILLFFSILLVNPSQVRADNCDRLDPRQEMSEKERHYVSASAQTIWKIVGAKIPYESEIQREYRDLFDKYPNPNKASFIKQMTYLFCTIQKGMNPEEKHKRLLEFQAELARITGMNDKGSQVPIKNVKTSGNYSPVVIGGGARVEYRFEYNGDKGGCPQPTVDQIIDKGTSKKPESNLWKLDSLDSLAQRAERNDPEAEYRLGEVLYEGRGIDRNPEKAVAWIKRAAEHNHTKAQITLAAIYRLGAAGTKQDAGEAAKWMEKAAEKGSAEAQYRLG